MATKFKNGITSEAAVSLPYKLITESTALTATDYTVACNSVYTITSVTTTNTQWVFTTSANHSLTIGSIASVSNLNPIGNNLFNSTFVVTAVTSTTFTVDAIYPYANNTYTGLSGKLFGSLNVTLPSAVGIQGRIYNIKNIADGTIIIGTTSSQLIDGSSTHHLEAAYHSVTVQSTGNGWIII